MNIFKKIKIKRYLKNEKCFMYQIDHKLVNKKLLNYYLKMLPKYGFKAVGERKNKEGNSIISVYCNKERAEKVKVYDDVMELYADNSLVSTPSNTTYVCSKCKYYSECLGEGGV